MIKKNYVISNNEKILKKQNLKFFFPKDGAIADFLHVIKKALTFHKKKTILFQKELKYTEKLYSNCIVTQYKYCNKNLSVFISSNHGLYLISTIIHFL